MKLLVPHPSCSSSSPSSTSFDTNICSHRSGGSSAGCVFGVLRRLLSARSSQNLETFSVEEGSVYENMMMKNYEQKEAVVDASPGIVARLMGLDSLPERITRSRSLNSMDQIREKDECLTLHRRVKTSVSFREMPTCLDLEDDDFIILRLDRGRRDKGSRSRSTKSETSIEGLKQEGSERQRSRAKASTAAQDATPKQSKPCQAQSSDGETAKLSRTVKYNYINESAQNENQSRRNKRCWSVNKKIAAQIDSEESSPVSIFYFNTTDQETETPTSADEDSWNNRSSSSSMVSSPEPDNTKISTEQKTEAVECGQHALLNKTFAALNGQKNSQIWGRIVKLTVAEIIGADWAEKDGKDLAAEFEVQIMDRLMNELVDLLH